MDFHKKYNGKDILIIGGGTSTIDTKWENIINPDTYIWTCNDFYMNERVSSQNIDLYQLAYTTKLKDRKLISYLNKYKPFTYFEKEKVKPKANRAVFFDPSKNHASSLPTDNNRRVNINVNYF